MAKTKSLPKERLYQHKSKAAPINYRALKIDVNGELVEEISQSLEKRVVKGYLVQWGVRNMYGEKFVKGCFAKSIQEHGPDSNAAYKIKFLNQHRQNEPCALMSVLREDDFGLYFETMPFDDVSWANNLLTQIRSGTINNLSIGFDFIWDKIEFDDDDDSLVVIEARLFEGSAVSIPADMTTYIVRNVAGFAEIHDRIDNFIAALPKKNQMEARELFSLQKSLINTEPQKKKLDALRKNKPIKKKEIDYNYLLKNI